MPQDVTHISVVLNRVRFSPDGWKYPFTPEVLRSEVQRMDEDLRGLGLQVVFAVEEARKVEVRGYPDLLNAIRIRSSRPGLGNLCLGHIIGRSANLDLLEDVRRGVKRVAFAPETIEPDGSDKVVCHNCGCGC